MKAAIRRQFEEYAARRGETAPLPVRQLLIALRRDRGVTSNELARRLGVPESDLLCNERNQYGGMTVQEAAVVLNALLMVGPSTALILVSAVATAVAKGQ